MLDEPCDVFFAFVRRGKLGADLSGTETTGLNPGAEPIDRALVMADRSCGIAEPAEFRQERVTVRRQPAGALGHRRWIMIEN